MPVRHSHPLINELCEKLDVLDPTFTAFADLHSYVFTKTEEGNFNPPHRRLQRTISRFEIRQYLSLQIVGRDPVTNAPPPFGPNMPFTLSAMASVTLEDDNKSIREEIFRALPFSLVQRDLMSYLNTAQQRLDEWNFETLVKDGISASDTLKR